MEPLSLEDLAAQMMEPPAPKVDRTLQTTAEDDCCARRLQRSLSKTPTLERWECPKCGTEWLPRHINAMRHWEPHCPFMVIR